MKKKKIICFDLDGTLAPSKQRIDDEMAWLINKLLKNYHVSVITWWWEERFQKQIFDYITTDEELLNKFIPCPNCGAKMYKFDNGKWNKLYSLDFSHEEKRLILKSLDEVLDLLDLRPEKTWWELVEHRWSQITFSALGQEAPLEEKIVRDPDFKKRKVIQAELEKRIPNFSINAGWSTSIDITMKWIDKAFGVKKLLENFPIEIDDFLFIWDAVFPGWNDYTPFTIWVDSVKIDDIEYTKRVIRKLIEDWDLDDEWLYRE